MQAQAGFGVFEFLFWIMAGTGLLGLPPGERDPALIKSVPPQTLVYFEWAARGNGRPGAAGIDGFAADPEVRQLTELLQISLAKRAQNAAGESNEPGNAEIIGLVSSLTAHPGCLFVGFEPPPLKQNGMQVWLNMLTGLHGGIVISSGDETTTLWQSFKRVMSSIPDFQWDDASSTQSIPLQIPGYQLVMHREGQRILFAFGEGTLPRILEGLSGRLPGLDTNPRFRRAIDRVAVPRVSTIGWVDLEGTLGGVTKGLSPLGGLFRSILGMIGADALDHIVQCSGVDNDTMVQRTFVATGGRTDGLLALVAGQPIEPSHLAHVPADVDLLVATSLSLKSVFQEVRQLLSKTQPLSVAVFDDAVKQLESELKLKLVEDILPAFGDVVTAFDSPAAGGLIATSLMISLEIRDPVKAKPVFERLMNFVDQSLTSELSEENDHEPASLKQQQFLGHTVFYVHSAEGGFSSKPQLTPTFCLTDRHLMFAVHPQAMKAHLRYLQSRKQGFDPQRPGKAPLVPGETISYAYLNGSRASGLMGTLIPYLSHNWLNRLEMEGIQLDSFALPSAAAVGSYFGDATLTTSRQKEGLFIETRNAPPVIVSIALLSAYDAWNTPDYELMEARRRRGHVGQEAQLGAAENSVVPALAEIKESPPASKNKPSAYRKLAPLFLKALIPDDVQQLIPESAFRKLGEGPSPETIQRREDARRKREERRHRRLP